MEQLLEALTPEALGRITASSLRFIAMLAVAFVASRIVSRLIQSLNIRVIAAMKRGAAGAEEELEKRASTLIGMIRKAAVLAIWVLALIMALQELGFDIGPLLAGAGVLGLAVGFGGQNLVRDVIAGLFMLLENQIRVNDVVIINGTGGLVEEVNLRTTVLRSLDGTVHIFPNGTISTLSNMTREFSFYVFDLGVAYKEDTDRVVEVIRQVGQELQETEEYGPSMLAPVEVLGVDKLADSAVVIKGRFKAQPMRQWAVGREFNRRIKRRFDELGIEIPFPHRSIYFGEASPPFRIGRDAIDREELKGTIREVLGEIEPRP
jgi:small conductance mechanosensitive channel